MPRPERRLDPDADAVQKFACELRELRRNAGSPAYRLLARSAHYSPATLAEAAGGRRLPSRAVALAYARACGGDERQWEAKWHAAHAPEEHRKADRTVVQRCPRFEAWLAEDQRHRNRWRTAAISLLAFVGLVLLSWWADSKRPG